MCVCVCGTLPSDETGLNRIFKNPIAPKTTHTTFWQLGSSYSGAWFGMPRLHCMLLIILINCAAKRAPNLERVPFDEGCSSLDRLKTVKQKGIGTH
jgi:hypothetical protein